MYFYCSTVMTSWPVVIPNKSPMRKEKNIFTGKMALGDTEIILETTDDQGWDIESQVC